MNTIWISELDEIHSGNGGCSRTAAAYLIVRSAEMELQLQTISTHNIIYKGRFTIVAQCPNCLATATGNSAGKLNFLFLFFWGGV